MIDEKKIWLLHGPPWPKPEEVYARVLGEFDLVNVSIEFDHPFQDLQGRDLAEKTVLR